MIRKSCTINRFFQEEDGIRDLTVTGVQTCALPIYRAMPLNAPQSLMPDEVYAVVAWLLHQNGIIPLDAVMDAQTLPAVKMPNREGFVSDPRPDVLPRP